MTFAEKLVELRTEAGLTQQALAERSGIPLTTVRKLEQAQTSKRINFGFVVRIAVALGTKCDAFAGCPDVSGVDGDVQDTHAADVPKPKRGRPKKTNAEKAG